MGVLRPVRLRLVPAAGKADDQQQVRDGEETLQACHIGVNPALPRVPVHRAPDVRAAPNSPSGDGRAAITSRCGTVATHLHWTMQLSFSLIHFVKQLVSDCLQLLLHEAYVFSHEAAHVSAIATPGVVMNTATIKALTTMMVARMCNLPSRGRCLYPKSAARALSYRVILLSNAANLEV